MFKSILFWRLYATYALITLIAATTFGSGLYRYQLKRIDTTFESRLRDAAHLLMQDAKRAIENGTLDEFQVLLQLISAQPTIRYAVLSADGRLLADSTTRHPINVDLRNRPEIQQARNQGVGMVRRRETEGQPTLAHCAVRLGTFRQPTGYIRVSADVQQLDADYASAYRLIWGTALAVAVAAVLATYVVVRGLVRPITQLNQAGLALPSRHVERTAHISSRDELGTLAQSFNSMSRELASRISELQHKSRELEENSERLRTVLGAMVEGVLAVDDQERILFANAAARSMLDLSGPYVVGRPVWEAVRNTTIQNVIRRALAGEQHSSIEFDLARTQSTVAMVATPLPGEICPGVVLVLHDVTELRRLENIRREFVSNVSHELKTPLASIQACAETLLGGAIDDVPANRNFVQRIEEQAERLHVLIMDLLSLARIEAQQQTFEVVRLAMDEIVRSCVDQHRDVADTKEIALTAEIKNSPIEVMADAEGIRTLLDNLVDNALNYTGPQGQIIVRCYSDRENGVIEVADTGIGIAPDHQSRIFERFYRIDRARSREMGGTGLGLAIVKHLVQLFGGQITLKSRLGQGSTFTIRIPLAG